MKPRTIVAALSLLLLADALSLAGTALSAQRGPDTVFLEELTWTEVRARIDAGTTTIIVPTAGTEQNGPHMVLGKHKFIVNHASNLIARELGNALVAPVVTYVPEGSVENIRGHMRYAGTITLPNEHFMKLLEYAARSLAVHGFTDVVFIGDSGGNQGGMRDVAAMLNEEWAGEAARVHFVGDYYSAHGINDWLLEEYGHTPETIGGHAGIRDTSQLLYVAPQHIRTDKLAPLGGGEGMGVSGDPTLASAEKGRQGIQMKVDAALRQIGDLMAR